jgi:hypothetical protein
MQISPTNPLKPLSGDGVAFNILAISHKNSGKFLPFLTKTAAKAV